MSINMHGTQYRLSQHNKILQNVEVYWLCSKTSKCNVKRAGLRFIVLPCQQL